MTQKAHLNKDFIHTLTNTLSGVSICVFDCNLRCTVVTGSIFDTLKLTEEKILGRPVEKLLGGLDNPDKLVEYCRLAIDGDETGFELTLNGIRFQAKSTPLPADEQLPGRMGMIVFMELPDSRDNKMYEVLLNASPDALVIVDERGKIVRINSLTEAMFGYNENELVGKSIEALLPKRFRAAHTGNLGSYFANPKTRQMGSGLELVALHKDGCEFPVDISLSPVNTKCGVRVVSAIRDITPQKQAETELRAARDHLEFRVKERTAELQLRNQELDAFAQMVAHDLKSPLTYFMGMAGLLHQSYASFTDREIKEQLDLILQQSHKMDSIISELLVLSSVRQQKPPLPEVIDMNSVVAEAQNRLVYLAKEYKAKIVTPDHWPPVLGHPAWVEAVWVNYISNAIKYGGRPPVIELGATPQANGMVRFWVQDNGLGLKSDEQEQLFNAFTRLGNIRVDGHGVGLTIVRRMIEKLDGQVGVESRFGDGSVFYFTLPEAAS